MFGRIGGESGGGGGVVVVAVVDDDDNDDDRMGTGWTPRTRHAGGSQGQKANKQKTRRQGRQDKQALTRHWPLLTSSDRLGMKLTPCAINSSCMDDLLRSPVVDRHKAR